MEMQTAQELIPRRLKGENFTCAGCRYRVLVGIASKGRENRNVWSENCLKKQKPPEDHTNEALLHGTSPGFSTPCALFYGVIEREYPIALNRSEFTHPALPQNLYSQVVSLREGGANKLVRKLVKKLGGTLC
jgi:hypothetical protein